MSDLDPFADSAFVTRLQKLLGMMGSAQQAEAEAARRKLLEHLGHHRLSLTDVSKRLGEGVRPASPGPSFSGGAREMHLERQLGIARSAKQEAEAEASISLMRLTELQSILHRANYDMVRLINGQTRMRYITGGACAVAALCLILTVLAHIPAGNQGPQQFTVVHEGPMSLKSQGQAPAAPARALVSERLGQVAVQDLAVRLTPNDDAGVRAFLNLGEKVLIVSEVRIGLQTWMLIRSETGSGWVRAGDILH